MAAAKDEEHPLSGFLITMMVNVNDVLGVETAETPALTFLATVKSDDTIEITAPRLDCHYVVAMMSCTGCKLQRMQCFPSCPFC